MPAGRHARTGLPDGGRCHDSGAHLRGTRHRAPVVPARRAPARTGAWLRAGWQARSRPAPGLTRHNPVALLRLLVDRAVARWQARRRRARELNELFAFDERELRDLGLSRSDFMAIEKGTYHRD